jgi:chromatin segregation and condensation protein Rec8/ScpA/Scc1 (kleisin family)
MVARLAEIREFQELVEHFNELREDDVKKLARKTYAKPEEHDRIEWERLRAYHAGIDAVLGFPAKSIKHEKESQ